MESLLLKLRIGVDRWLGCWLWFRIRGCVGGICWWGSRWRREVWWGGGEEIPTRMEMKGTDIWALGVSLLGNGVDG
ncbi:predicted protein [Sclerotinia sclerotiorum 1980 UF-70]|uniref:Uncharacterized protein n=1 Tax=Sclerotinia sclerotiorum (strain ATCC 18683 / 1980 / Ss-1) TaxID=665079 RepID=A7EL95_SCLS1|nr:predicted protein [Sclerotinia sclerotiorum 1980 UF-70]EDO03611.1 predicted protein [Sclerotinia sclerotiorum 1980 UF-70]